MNPFTIVTSTSRATLLALSIVLCSGIPSNCKAQGLMSLFSSMCVRTECGCFLSPGGHPVTVEHYLPKANCCSPAVIILHGSDGMERFGDQYREAAKALAAEGYAAFIVSYFEGAPGTVRPGPEDRHLPDPKAFAPWLSTVIASIQYVKQQPCVDPNRVGIVGFSLGGYLATAAAVHKTGIKAVVELSGGLPNNFYNKVHNLPPTLIVHGDRDDTIPVGEAYKLHATLASRRKCHDLMILPCEGHLPYECYKDAAAKRALCFLDMNL